MLDFKDIAKSWMVSMNPSEEELDKANSRIDICDSCEYKNEFLVYFCSVCFCPLQKKIYSDGTCPMGKWIK